MLTRRHFFYATTALTLAPSVRAFAAPGPAGDNAPVLVTLFLRGGMDSLGVVAPVDDVDYAARGIGHDDVDRANGIVALRLRARTEQNDG